jgi:hypothetical protein
MKYKILIFLCLSAKILSAQEVVFRTSVENLRLREQPNLESKVIKTVPKGTRLEWSGIRSEQKVSADWKGVKVADYWYKVQTYQDTTAWVFGKGIEFLGLNFGTFENPKSPKSIDNQWIKIEESREYLFQKLKEIDVDWQKIDRDTIKDKSKFILAFDNGKKKLFEGYEGYSTYHYGTLAIENKVYYQCYADGCMGRFFWIRKSDGKEMNDYSFPTFYSKEKNGKFINLPIFAPDKKTFIFGSGCTYSDNNDCEGRGQSIIFNVGQFQNDKTETIASFEELRVDDFRFITNRSGIAKLQNGSYWKITLK